MCDTIIVFVDGVQVGCPQPADDKHGQTSCYHHAKYWDGKMSPVARDNENGMRREDEVAMIVKRDFSKVKRFV